MKESQPKTRNCGSWHGYTADDLHGNGQADVLAIHTVAHGPLEPDATWTLQVRCTIFCDRWDPNFGRDRKMSQGSGSRARLLQKKKV
eukprot:5206467-Amphidinium_carterae.1